MLALAVLDVPLARLAHQSLDASGGSSPFWFSVALGVVGFVVAWRRPRNPLGWILLGGAAFGALSQDASFYVVADYRLRHGGLPLGWIAVLAQPGWAAGIVLTGLAVLLFPDGRPPSPRWRWVLWLYLAVATLYLVGPWSPPIYRCGSASAELAPRAQRVVNCAGCHTWPLLSLETRGVRTRAALPSSLRRWRSRPA